MTEKEKEAEQEVKEHIRLIEKSLLHPDLSKVEYDKDFKKYMVSSIIPTAELFKEKLNHIEYRIDEGNKNYESLKTDIDKRFDEGNKNYESLKADMDKRFDSMQCDMDKRFDSMQGDMDKRFEQVDKRFEQVDKRFDSMQCDMDKRFDDLKLDLDKRFDKVDNSINRLADIVLKSNENNRMFTVKMFMASITITVLLIGVLGSFLKQ